MSVPMISTQTFRLQDSEFDSELRDIVAQSRTNIIVIGLGGAGCNTVNRLKEVGISGAKTVALNTDAQSLYYTRADVKILAGRNSTKGRGAGGDPELGYQAAQENIEDLKSVMMGADLVFITLGLGGGTGTGSAPLVAKISKKMGAITIGVVTLPFRNEGIVRSKKAMEGLEKLQKEADNVIVISNDKLLNLAPDLPLKSAFKLTDEVLTLFLKSLTEMILKPGLVNLDFADVRSILQNEKLAMLGVGEAYGKDRVLHAIKSALENPLLDLEVKRAKKALIHITAGSEIKIDEIKDGISFVQSIVGEDAHIIWGLQVDEDLKDTVRVMIILTGMDRKVEVHRELSEELGLVVYG
ncbi:MAG: cell division protein FtsZ [Candidatus Hydrothermarchaeota archaeon]